jgi:hypothetical protein
VFSRSLDTQPISHYDSTYSKFLRLAERKKHGVLFLLFNVGVISGDTRC